jgi:methylated-DNA-protein-cysteine methyltransferase-like protein
VALLGGRRTRRRTEPVALPPARARRTAPGPGPPRLEELSARIVRTFRAIPKGRVATYGQIAALAGVPGAARRVAWLLHSSSRKRRLPWHRVIGASGRVSLPQGGGYELQRALLEAERVVFRDERVDLGRFQWKRGRPPTAARRRPAPRARSKRRRD